MRPVFERLDELGIEPGLRDDGSPEDDSLIKELEATIGEFHKDDEVVPAEIPSPATDDIKPPVIKEDRPAPIIQPGLAFPISQDPADDFMPGSRVSHSQFGRGTVLEREGEGDNTKFTVRFDKIGVRKLAAKYACLKCIS